jgi:protein O-GlcNAc transferase
MKKQSKNKPDRPGGPPTKAGYPPRAISLYQEASALKRNGDPRGAERLLRQALAVAPDMVPALNDLALMQAAQGKWREAELGLRRALRTETEHPLLLSNLGDVLQRQGRLDEAIGRLEQSLAVAPDFPHALNNLANCYRAQGQYGPALALYRRAIEQAPAEPAIRSNLGACLLESGQAPEAIATLSEAIALDPGCTEAYANLGNAYLHTGRLEEAAGAFLAVLRRHPESFPGCMGLGHALARLNRPAEAQDAFRKALSIDKGSVAALVALGLACGHAGKYEASLRYFEQARKRDPLDAAAMFGAAMAAPLIYRSEDEIDSVRGRWLSQVRALARRIESLDDQALRGLRAAVTAQSNFYLSYQGRNDLELQRLFGAILGRIARAVYPTVAARRYPGETAGRRIRVGFLSSYLRRHSVYKSHSRWLTDLCRERFEVFGIHAGDKSDDCTAELESAVEHFIRCADNDALVEILAGLHLDALVFLDVGMDRTKTILAALRFAPVQATTYGHPVTSGLESIDYFLSSALMEPDNGQEHYCETLVPLANLCAPYRLERPETIRTPASAQRAPDEIVFVNPQNPMKLLPRFDTVYPRIALRLPRSRFWFVQGTLESAAEVLRMRLDAAFRSHGLAMDEYCVFHPPLRPDEFFGLLQAADLVLDPPASWSGFNTSMEALSLDKPIVTLPGELMRGRHTYGILKMLGIEETIADTIDEYIAIAVRLGEDRELRERIGRQISERKHVLYDDTASIRDLERFLLDRCRDAGDGSLDLFAADLCSG